MRPFIDYHFLHRNYIKIYLFYGRIDEIYGKIFLKKRNNYLTEK